MDPVRNPFAPGAGNPPPELAGRKDLLAAADTMLSRVSQGRHAKGMIWAPAHGDTAFTVPLFDEFLKRQMPEFERG